MDSMETWKKFFSDAGIPASDAAKYADTFAQNRIQTDMLTELNEDFLMKYMGITIIGDVIAILRHSKHVYKEIEEKAAEPRRESPLKNNTTESPPKKRSKKDMFLEAIKGKEHDVVAIVGEASSIITHLEDQNEKIASELLISDFILGFRSTLHKMEKLYSPKWLLKLAIRHSERWAIIFTLNSDNDDIKIFHGRMEKLKIKVTSLCKQLDHILENANVQHHEGEIPAMVDDDQWDIIFKRLKLNNIDERNTLKVLLTSITQEDKNKVWKTVSKKRELKVLVQLKGLPFDYSNDDVKQFFSSVANQISEVFIFKNEIQPQKNIGEGLLIVNNFNQSVATRINEKNGHKFPNSSLTIKIHPWSD